VPKLDTQSLTQSVSNSDDRMPQESRELKQRAKHMLKLLNEEFNCHHEANLETGETNKIYNREDEHEQIKKFLVTNMEKGKSGLMYLCGHPGTGKTSSLNYVLSELKQQGNYLFRPVLFNAMTFTDVMSFMIVLYERLHETFFGEETSRKISRHDHDAESLALLIEKLLKKISDNKKFKKDLGHKIIVIDEVDTFTTQERQFTTLIQ